MATLPSPTSENAFKVVILGSGRVGKTSLLLRYVRGTFDNRQISTINAQFLEKTMNWQGQRVHLHIWDTAGQEVFKAIAPIYYRKAAAVLLVFDLTDANTLPEAVKWVKEVEREKALVVLVGNKRDLGGKRSVEEGEVRRCAQELGVKCYYTSAKTGEGVEELFMAVAQALLCRRSSSPVSSPRSRKTLKIEQKPTRSSTSCC